MILEEIDYYFEDEKKLEKLVLKYKEVFDRIEYYQKSLKDSIIEFPHEMVKALAELSAMFSTLNVVARLAVNEADTREAKYYVKKKQNLEYLGQKPSTTTIEKEAMVEVYPYRKISTYFESQRDCCSQMIYTLQSCLKSAEREKSFHG